MAQKPPKILYHYCSNQTFCSIVQNKTIWLSSLRLSNDTQEGLWIDRIFDNFLKNTDEAKEFKERIKSQFFATDGLGFCLSEQGDMLSQWRGYANDGSGISIGFSTDHLNERDADDTQSGYSLQKVRYKEDEQNKLMAPFIQSIGEWTLNNTEDSDVEISVTISKFIYQFWDLKFKLKNPAFSEEKEWRLISPYVPNRPSGADSANLRSDHNRLIPYRKYDFGSECISEIILGPKNISNTDDLENYLKLQGFLNVDVHPSSASYR